MRYLKYVVAFTFLSTVSGLHLKAQTTDKDFAKRLLQRNVSRISLNAVDIANAEISDTHTDSDGLTFVYLQQKHKGIEVFNSILTLVFRHDSLVYQSGSFVPVVQQKAGTSVPALSASQAIEQAVLYLGENANTPVVLQKTTGTNKYYFSAASLARKDIEVRLVWLPLADKNTLLLAWNVNMAMRNSTDWWNVRINANTGTFLEKDNWTVHEKATDINGGLQPDLSAMPLASKPDAYSFGHATGIKNRYKTVENAPTYFLQAAPSAVSAAYKVAAFPKSSAASGFSIQSDPWTAAATFDNRATTLQWHSDSVTDYNITKGNNAFAYLNPTGSNISNASTNWPDTSALFQFVHTQNTIRQPDGTIENKKVALDNLFYWTNLLHDIFYLYGFDEAAGNFQSKNLGRGGEAGDWVNALAHNGNSLDNASFSTGADGTAGDLHMYLWQTVPTFRITAPATIAGFSDALESNFSNINNKLKGKDSVSGQVLLYNDDVNGWVNTACGPATNSAQLSGKIALIYAPNPGACTLLTKVQNARNANCTAIIMYSDSQNPFPLTAITTNSDTIPTISIGKTTALNIIDQLEQGILVYATLKSGIYRDGSLDNEIISHEYGHGVSHRLTGGPANASAMSNAENGDEGWSDYFALMMTTDWNSAQLSTGITPRTIGSYANSSTGIRRRPYSTNRIINPYTYDSVKTNPEIHAIGEVWCSALWDMTWNIIQQRGITGNLYNIQGTGGNVVALKLVMKGLKMQVPNPGFIDARNALLAADRVMFGGADTCAIWTAFARRGMGYFASQGSANSTSDQIPDKTDPCNRIVPVRFTSIKAYQSGTGIQVEWENASEQNIQYYVVEKSADGKTFDSKVQVPATHNNGGTASYAWPDVTPFTGNNFYRIKAAEANGSLLYSPIENVKILNGQSTIAIYPNPVKGNTLWLQFNNQPPGQYEVLLTTVAGQVLHRQTIAHTGGSSTQTIQFPNTLTKGIYQLQIVTENRKIVEKIICD